MTQDSWYSVKFNQFELEKQKAWSTWQMIQSVFQEESIKDMTNLPLLETQSVGKMINSSLHLENQKLIFRFIFPCLVGQFSKYQYGFYSSGNKIEYQLLKLYYFRCCQYHLNLLTEITLANQFSSLLFICVNFLNEYFIFSFLKFFPQIHYEHLFFKVINKAISVD